MEHQVVGLYGAHRLSLWGKVGKTDGVVLDNSALNELDFRRQAGFVSGGEVDEHVSAPRHQSARSSGQLLHQLGVAAGTADAVQAPETRQEMCIRDSYTTVTVTGCIST